MGLNGRRINSSPECHNNSAKKYAKLGAIQPKRKGNMLNYGPFNQKGKETVIKQKYVT